MEVLVGVASLQAKRGEIKQVLDLLLIVLNHPSIIQDTRSCADRLRAELDAQLSMDFRQFDYDTISNVILNVRYTSIDRGSKPRKIAADSITDHVQRVTELSQDGGLVAVFDLAHDFPSEWYKTMHLLRMEQTGSWC